MPNVSYCVSENEVHYNPLPYQGFCKLTLNDGSVEELEGSGELTRAKISAYSATVVSVEIGEACTSIGDGLFAGWSNLKTVTIGNNITSIGSSAFEYCTSLTSVTIPDSVTSLGESAFRSCSGLTSVTIGSGVTSIGDDAFERCSSLTNVTVKATIPPSLGRRAFDNNASGRIIYVPSASWYTYYYSYGWSNYAYYIRGM